MKKIPKIPSVRTVYPSKDGIEDSRNNWYKGTVKSILSNTILVNLDSAPELRQFEIYTWSIGKKAETVNHQADAASKERDIQEFIALAKSKLRYITWSTIKHFGEDIFAQSPREVTMKEGYDIDMYYKLHTKKVDHLNGKAIDFFISHAWVDDSKWKYKVVKELPEKIMKENKGEEPTFWFDKFCIEQSNTADGLRVLPINLMSCKKMLVLVGASYPKRLWCAWELYDRLINTSLAQEAIEGMEIYTQGTDTVRKLFEFKLRKAYCWDPNEQNKLRNLIEPFEDEFNDRMFDLAKHMITSVNNF